MRSEECEDIEKELINMEEQQEEFKAVTNRMISEEEDMRFQNGQMIEMLKEGFPYASKDKELQRLKNEQIEQYEQLIQAQNRFIEDSEEETKESKGIYARKEVELEEELRRIEERTGGG